MFGIPIGAGMLSVAELKQRLPDGNPLIELHDVFDMHEIMIVKNENEWRAQKAAEKKAGNK